MLKAEGLQSTVQTPFKKKETIVEKTLFFYLVNHVYCLACEFQTWTFDIMSDLILNIDEEKDKFYAERIERVQRWRMGGYRYVKKKEREESMKSDYSEEKEEASMKLDKKMKEDTEKYVDGMITLDLADFGEDLHGVIPNLDKTKDRLHTPGHIIPSDQDVKTITLYGLLDNFFKTNLMNNKDNYYTCEKCRETVDMEKNIMFITRTYRLYDLPDNLAISLKRFRQTSGFTFMGRGGFSKINTDVDYPARLDLSKYVMSNFSLNFRKKRSK
jgi:ubiquitin C-terminal hydrolase